MTPPSFPPLFHGEPAPKGQDPFALACAFAADGTDAGLVVYALDADHLRAAIVFAPEVALDKAAVMLPLCGVGFQNALGALAPPALALHLDWSGALRVNGGLAGQLKAASGGNADAPDWLVVGLEVALWPPAQDGGQTPDSTALYAEGCADVGAVELLEAWVRHTLVWLNTWDTDGIATLHREWLGLAHGIGEDITVLGQTGTFTGIDENLGLLLTTDTTTRLIPLTALLAAQA